MGRTAELPQHEATSRPWAVRAIAGLLTLNTAIAGVEIATHDKNDQQMVDVLSASEEVRSPVTLAPKHTPVLKHVRPHLASSPKPDPHPTPPQRKANPQAPDYGPISLSRFEANPMRYISKLPTLDILAKYFPDTYTPEVVAEDKSQIAALKAAVHPTVEDYKDFSIDTTHKNAFSPHPSYNRRITMRMGIIHWTAEDNDLAPLDLVDFMLKGKTPDGKPNRKSVGLYEGHQAEPHVSQLIEDETHMTASARGANEWSQSLEIAAESIDGKSPLFDLTPRQLEVAIETEVKVLRRNNLPISAWTLMGHQDVDLLFNNPDYDPTTGKFAPGAKLRKSDPPHEIMTEIILPQAIRLDAELKAAGINN